MDNNPSTRNVTQFARLPGIRTIKSHQKVILIVSESHMPGDARVFRFAQAMTTRGDVVVGAGYQWNNTPELERRPLSLISVHRNVGSRLRRWYQFLTLVPTRLTRSLAFFSYWCMPERNRLWWAIKRELRDDSLLNPNIVIAKNWSAVPIALRVQKLTGARLIYDIDDAGPSSNDGDRVWRPLMTPLVKGIEKAAFRRADAITTSGDATAEETKRRNRLRSSVITIRNLPMRPTAPPVRPDLPSQIVFLYQGAASQEGILAMIIKSAESWGPDRFLKLRLTGRLSDIEALKQDLEDRGLGEKIQVLAPVPPDLAVEAAAELADVGLCLYPKNTPYRLAEPDVLYQYMSAGLAVIATNLPGMEPVLERHGFGALVPTNTPEQISMVANAIAPEKVAEMKKKARQAAEQLCWENEQDRLLGVLELVAGTPGRNTRSRSAGEHPMSRAVNH